MVASKFILAESPYFRSRRHNGRHNHEKILRLRWQFATKTLNNADIYILLPLIARNSPYFFAFSTLFGFCSVLYLNLYKMLTKCQPAFTTFRKLYKTRARRITNGGKFSRQFFFFFSFC